jgi:hypothetical protein
MATTVSGSAASTGSPQYRFRNGTEVSGWMSSEQLKEAARRGVLTPIGLVQQAGQADWVPAAGVRGLFQAEAKRPEDAPTEAVPAAPVATDSHGHGRHLRFATLKEVLAAFLNAEIEILEDSSSQSRKLVAVATDHFECLDEPARQREFIPYARIARLLTVDAVANGPALAYRDSHRLRIALAGA